MSNAQNMRKIIESLDPSQMVESPSDASELQEIMEEMLQLLDAAHRIVRSTGNSVQRARAETYWIPHIRSALEGGQGTMFSMADTIEELSEMDPDGDEDDGSMEFGARQNGMR